MQHQNPYRDHYNCSLVRNYEQDFRFLLVRNQPAYQTDVGHQENTEPQFQIGQLLLKHVQFWHTYRIQITVVCPLTPRPASAALPALGLHAAQRSI